MNDIVMQESGNYNLRGESEEEAEKGYWHILEVLQKEMGNTENLVRKYENDYWIVREFSPSRSNVIAWLPFKEDDEILEIHAGCGALTEYIAKKVKLVDCIEESSVKAKINYLRNISAHNIKYYKGMNNEHGRLLTEKKYDYVIIWDKINDVKLEEIHSMLKPNGRMVVALDNKYGLKFWNGCADDMSYFATISSNKGGMNKRELLHEMHKAGFEDILVYYPYPDYRSTMRIYSDRYMPQKGELNENFYFGGENRLILFDETMAYDQLIELGRFAEFSNSYLLVAQKCRTEVVRE